MRGYIWRFPAYHWVALVSTATLLTAGLALLELRGRIRNAAGRDLVAALIALTFLASPAALATPLDRATRAAFLPFLSEQQLRAAMLAPALVAVVILTLASVLFREEKPWRRVGFVAAALSFLGLNLVDLGSPGWTAYFGFPLPYYWWEDGIVTIDGAPLWAPFQPTMIAVNVVVFGLMTRKLALMYRCTELGRKDSAHK